MDFCEKLKVCVVSPLGYTGLAYYNHSLCQSLSGAGVEVTLVTSDTIIVTPKIITYTIVKTFKGTYGKRSRIKKGVSYTLCMLKLLQFILKKRFRIVHFQILELPLVDVVVFSLLRAMRIKIVFTPHDIYSFKPDKNIRLQYLLYKLSDVVVVHNSANKTLLIKELKLSSDKIEILLHGNYNYFLNSNISKDIAESE